MLKVIRSLLLRIVADIDSGNTNNSEEELIQIAKVLQSYTDKTQKLSKYKACQYLNVSRATFDNYVREGLLPRGKKEAGFKELFWIEKDLDKFKESRRNANRGKI